RPGGHRVHRTTQFAGPFEAPFDWSGETDGSLALARHEVGPEPGFSPEFRLSQARLLKAVPDYVTVPGMALAPAYGRPTRARRRPARKPRRTRRTAVVL